MSRMFKWTDGVTENFVNLLHDFKTKINFRGLDFGRGFQDTETRKVMAAMYEKEDISFFGRLESRSFDLNEKEIESLYEEEIKNTKIDIKEHNLNISRYRNRVQGKIKDIRQNFSKVVVNGTRSGNGKIVFTHFDLLKEV